LAASPESVPLPHVGNACQLLHPHGLGCAPFARHYSGHRHTSLVRGDVPNPLRVRCCFLFVPLLRCFSSRASPRRAMYSPYDDTGCARARFPDSGIPGSQPACGSPGLIAACHALLRPLVPRHPPRALSSLTAHLNYRSYFLPPLYFCASAASSATDARVLFDFE